MFLRQCFQRIFQRWGRGPLKKIYQHLHSNVGVSCSIHPLQCLSHLAGATQRRQPGAIEAIEGRNWAAKRASHQFLGFVFVGDFLVATMVNHHEKQPFGRIFLTFPFVYTVIVQRFDPMGNSSPFFKPTFWEKIFGFFPSIARYLLLL